LRQQQLEFQRIHPFLCPLSAATSREYGQPY